MAIVFYIILITLLGGSKAGSVYQKYRKFTNVMLPTTSFTTNGVTITECCQRCSSKTSCKLVRYDVTHQTCEESASSLLVSPHTMTLSQGVYITGSNNIYEYVMNLMTWSEAKTYCANRGGQLMKIDSAEEENLLKSWVSQYGHNPDSSSTLGPWIGLNLLSGSGWRWTDGSLLDGYINWGTDQPDNADGIEKCVQMWYPDLNWNDQNCNDAIWSVCEYNNN